MALIISSSNKQATSHAEAEPFEAKVCDHTLTKVLSWLDVPDLCTSAALVSQRWAAAAGCKEVFRRRMHCNVLETLFNPQHTKPQQQQQQQEKPQAAPSSCGCNADSDQQQQRQEDPAAAAIAAVAAVRLSPARLFASLYGSNLLVNGSFLERLNSHKGAARRLVWEPTFNARGTTWAHPFDFYPELCPLPEDTHRPGSSSSSKPFSIGCLAAAGGAWSEVVQVIELQPALVTAGVPAATACWLITAGLTLEFSVLVAGGAAAGGEYQVVLSLVSAADADSAAASALPLSAVPRMTLPFGHPPPNHPGLEAVSAAQMTARGLGQGSRNVAKAPLHPPPGIWTRYTCRAVLPQDTPISHVAVALRGRATRNSRLGHYATKFADASLAFVTADEC